MIRSMSELTQTKEQLQRMLRALEALRREVLPVNPDLFAVMAEGPQDEIARLQADIDDFVGRGPTEQRPPRPPGSLTPTNP